MPKRGANEALDASPQEQRKHRSPTSPTVDVSDNRKDKLTFYLRSLNQQFAKWVATQAESHLGELWRDGVRDYLKHADKILSDFKDVLSDAPAATAGQETAPSATGSLLFGSSAGSKPPGSGLGAPAPSPAPSLFSFANAGSAPAPAFPSASQPAFGLAANRPPTAAAEAQGSQSGGAEDGDEEEAEREGSPGLKDDETVEKPYEVLWSQNTKLYEKGSGSSWADKGLGMLSIRRMKQQDGDKAPTPYIAFISKAGRALVTASLYKGLSPTIAKDGKSVLMKLVQPGEEEDRMVLFRTRDADAATNMKESVEKNNPQ